MRTAGIIAEYNPFHNGHAHQISRVRALGFDAVVCVMSPGVVQRGSLALMPAQVRAEAALSCGADVVLCLPAPYAAASAEAFAAAGVRASTISPLTTRSSRCTVRTQAFGSPSACRTSSGTPPGSSVDSTPAGLMHTRMLLS